MEEIKAGKVRESGILPELFKSEWPDVTSGVLVTGVDRKYQEHLSAINIGGYDFPLFLPPMIFPKVREDSKEAEKGSSSIARGKLAVSFLDPFRGEYDSLDEAGKKKFIRPVKERMGLADERAMIAISDDRSQYMTDILKEPVYGNLADHSNPQVRAVLSPEHGTPGERVKETDGANYGVLNALLRRQEAVEGLKANGAEVDEWVRLETTLCIAPVIPGLLPLPEEGIIVRAEGAPFKFRRLIEEDLQEAEGGRIFTYDDINFVPLPGLAGGHHDGIIISKLKKQHANHPFFVESFSPGLAMSAFAEMVGMPKKGVIGNLRRIWNGMNKTEAVPKTVVSSASMLTLTPGYSDVEASLELPGGMKLSKARGSFETLRELEALVHSGQAFVVQDPDKFPVPKNHGLKDKDGNPVSEEHIRLLRRLETDLIFAYLITMSTQSGSPNHFGRAHMVEKSYFEKYGKWHPDFCNLGLTGDVETEAYRVFETKDELEKGLECWSRDFYKHNVPTPANDFIRTQEDFSRITGLRNLGFTVSGYGSASSFIDQAYTDARDISYRLAQLGMTFVHGGGARSAMRGFQDGPIQAITEGAKARSIGIRSADVSPLEGNIVKLAEELGQPVQPGHDRRHFSFLNGQVHALELNRLLQRQAPIAALSHASVIVPGGKGTVVEKAITALHNARVRIFGEGLFPGFDSNTRIIPIFFSDHEFEYLGRQRRIFELLNAPYKEYEEFLGIREFSGPDRVERIVEAVTGVARRNGYQLKTPLVPASPLPLPAPVTEPA
jgi:predicted Rossmann-fold nucleotide-binding protein